MGLILGLGRSPGEENGYSLHYSCLENSMTGAWRQIEKILMTFPELASNYLITLTTDEDNDNMTVEVELEELFTDDFRRLQGLANRIQRALKDEILLTPHVKLLPKGTLPVSEGKAVRVVDKRTVYQ